MSIGQDEELSAFGEFINYYAKWCQGNYTCSGNDFDFSLAFWDNEGEMEYKKVPDHREGWALNH